MDIFVRNEIEENVATEFYSNLLELNSNSKYVILSLTILAIKHISHAGIITTVLEQYIPTVSCDIKLPLMYLIDSVTKNDKTTTYKKLFATRIVEIIRGVFEKVNEEIREKLYFLRHTWNAVFASNVLYDLDIKIRRLDNNWPVTAKPYIQNAHLNTIETISLETVEEYSESEHCIGEESTALQKQSLHTGTLLSINTLAAACLGAHKFINIVSAAERLYISRVPKSSFLKERKYKGRFVTAYCLSNDLAKPCYVVTFKGLRIMLDCGLTEQTVLNFLPLPFVQSMKLSNLPNWIPSREHDPQMDGELKECCGRVFVDSSPEFTLPMDKMMDFSEIDVILISNYLNMLALPYITEHTGFKGKVYATEPTLQIGRFFLEELVEYIEVAPKASTAQLWKDMLHILPSPLSEAFRPKKWRTIFGLKDVHNSLARVTIMGYDEKLDILGAFIATPVSSGYCLGSSNWVLSTAHEKICYVSGSSTLTTHPRPINQSALKHADVLIMTGLTQAPTVNPDTKLGELCMNVALTIRNNGSALIPCYPSGVVYDLFECLTQNLENAGLNNVPMFFISPVADSSLAYSNILAEWLSSAKQNKVYLPDDPFPHAFYLRNSKLKHYKHVFSDGFSKDFRQPCVVFCGHPSLRFGDAVHFIEMWGNNPNNSIIFTEPDFPYLQVLAPFQPLAMKAFYCPIDTSLNYQQANKLIKELKPNVLVIPEAYTKPHPNAANLFIEQPDKKIITFKCGEIIRLPLKRKLDRVFLTSEMAQKIVPRDVGNGVTISTITGILQVKDKVHNIKPCAETINELPSGSNKQPPPSREDVLKNVKYEYGTLDVDMLIKRLSQDGITNIKMERLGSALTLHLVNEDTTITFEDNETHIVCGGKQSLRLKLRDSLLKCLQTF